ncbi:MAG: replicative DNA helicase [Epsilonproteobacteria bacterium]|nr:replicative DNA helicase [Campylobacterota bacterium]
MEANLYNLDIERGVLSAILFDGANYEKVASILKPKDFYLPFHQHVFEVMEILYKRDYPIDETFIKEYLQNKNQFDESAMLEIISTAPVPMLESYSKELKDKAIKRELLHFSSVIKQEVYEHSDKRSTEIVEDVQSQLFNIATESEDGDFKDMDTVTTSTMQYIKAQIQKEGILTGLDTGFAALNRMTGGFNEGDLIIVAARPAMGKTSFALNIAANTLKQNQGVAIFSLEMPAEQLLLRMISSHTGISLQNVRSGNLNDDELSRVSEAMDYFASKKLFIDDNSVETIHSVRAKLRKLKALHPEVSLVIIDYLQLMVGDNKERHIVVAEVSRGLKMLARELKIPIIALSQLNRGLESRPDKRPMMSDLRESGAIEQDADVIMFVYRDDVYKLREAKQALKEAQQKGQNPDIKIEQKPIEPAEIIIAKQRNGPTGVAFLQFNKPFTRFEDTITTNEFHTPSKIEIDYEG